MGKRPDDLNLDPDALVDPGSHTRKPTSEIDDIRSTGWYQFIGEIDELLEDATYTWALDTLEGIRKTVEARRAVTEGQRRAITNIRRSGERREGGVRRRYEGWGR